MSRRAFTLIEVMVVLSVLAIIAILGYNFFGSTVKDAKLSAAAIEVARHMEYITAKYEDYRNDGNAPISGIQWFDPPVAQNLVFVRDYLDFTPYMPASVFDPSPGTNPNKTYRVRPGSNEDINGNGDNDTVIDLLDVTEDFCNFWNTKYETGMATPPVNLTVAMPAKPWPKTFCWQWNTTYLIYWLSFEGA